jgi:hypothetical protein
MSKDNIEGLDPNRVVGTIPFESKIKIEVSGFYYSRVIQLLTQFAADKGLDVVKMTEELKEREPATVDEYNFITLVSLCSEIENAAHKQEVIVERTMKEFMNAQENDPEY